MVRITQRSGPTREGGRYIEIDTPYLRASVVDGVVKVWELRTPTPPITLPKQVVPADYDPTDKSNFRSCCDPPPE